MPQIVKTLRETASHGGTKSLHSLPYGGKKQKKKRTAVWRSTKEKTGGEYIWRRDETDQKLEFGTEDAMASKAGCNQSSRGTGGGRDEEKVESKGNDGAQKGTRHLIHRSVCN